MFTAQSSLPCSRPPARCAADAIAQVQKARQIAAEFEFDNGYAQPVAYLAKKMADENQIYTQVRRTGAERGRDHDHSALTGTVRVHVGRLGEEWKRC